MVARLLQLGGCMRRGVRKGGRREREGVGKADEKARLGVRNSNLLFLNSDQFFSPLQKSNFQERKGRGCCSGETGGGELWVSLACWSSHPASN